MEPTLSVGIPVYNEEKNISVLIGEILKQTIIHAQLTEIIIYSDASTDRTVTEAKTVEDERIHVVNAPQRGGVTAGMNYMYGHATGDILIVLNGDVLPIGDLCFENLLQPLLQDQDIGISGADVVSANPRTYIERIVGISHMWKTTLYRRIDHGNTVYLCHGRGRAFSKHLYSQMRVPDDVPEDAYSYIYCKQQGLKFVYVQSAQMLFRSPQTLQDHIRQSHRFFSGNRMLEKYFPETTVKKEFHIPLYLLLLTGASFLLRYPVEMCIYTGILLYNYIYYALLGGWNYQPKWQVSITSKDVR